MKCIANANMECMEDKCKSWFICKNKIYETLNEERIEEMRKLLIALTKLVQDLNIKVIKLEKEIKNVKSSKSQVVGKSK